MNYYVICGAKTLIYAGNKACAAFTFTRVALRRFIEGKCIAVIFSHYATAVAEVKMAFVFFNMTQKSNTLVTNGNRVVIVQWSNISSNRVKSYNKVRNKSTKN